VSEAGARTRNPEPLSAKDLISRVTSPES
jgi:hypothetical protein